MTGTLVGADTEIIFFIYNDDGLKKYELKLLATWFNTFPGGIADVLGGMVLISLNLHNSIVLRDTDTEEVEMFKLCGVPMYYINCPKNDLINLEVQLYNLHLNYISMVTGIEIIDLIRLYNFKLTFVGSLEGKLIERGELA